MPQIKIHKNAAVRNAAWRRRKRLESLRRSFIGSSLCDFYLAKGADIETFSVVPAVKLNEFFESLPAMPYQTFLDSLKIPYIRVNKRLNTIRVVTSL